MPKRYCTVPDIFKVRKYWDLRHDDACRVHDDAAETLNIFKKLWSDLVLIWHLAKEAMLALFFLVGAVFVLPTIGTVHWSFMRCKQRSAKLQKLTDYIVGWFK